MTKSLKAILGIGSVIAILGISAMGFIYLSGRTGIAFAADPTPTPGSGPVQGPNGMWSNEYRDFFLNSLAGKLNVTVDALKSGFTAAISDTVNQAVKDGKLTQDQADKIKSALSSGNGMGFLRNFQKWNGNRFGFGGMMGPFSTQEFAKLLNMNQADLENELRSGKTISDVAKEKNVELAQMKQAFLADLKTQLDALVSGGKLTQAQEDQMLTNSGTKFDAFVTSTPKNGWMGGGMGFDRGHEMMGGRGFGAFSATILAKALNMTEQEVTTELQAGKSIADIAKEHNVDLQKVEQSVLADIKSQFDQAVKDGKITQQMADQMYQRISSGIDGLMNHTGGFGRFGKGKWGNGGGNTPTPTYPAPQT